MPYRLGTALPRYLESPTGPHEPCPYEVEPHLALGFRITSICGLFPLEHILWQHPFLSLAIFFLLTPSSLPNTVSPSFSPFPPLTVPPFLAPSLFSAQELSSGPFPPCWGIQSPGVCTAVQERRGPWGKERLHCTWRSLSTLPSMSP